MNILCIIPARGGSKRLPGKNLLPFQGKSFLERAIVTAKESKVFDAICVSSEDTKTLHIAKKHGAIALPRPPALASDRAQLKDVCLHILDHFCSEGTEYDAFALLLPTSPLRSAQDICGAAALFRKHHPDVVMSVVQYDHPPTAAVAVKNGKLKTLHSSQARKRSQDQPALYYHDGVILFCDTKAFRKRKEFYGPNVVPYFTPPERAVDVDTEMDLAFAEFLASRSSLS